MTAMLAPGRSQLSRRHPLSQNWGIEPEASNSRYTQTNQPFVKPRTDPPLS